MAMLKFGHATVVEPSIAPEAWTKSVCCGHKSCACNTGTCKTKIARQVLAKYAPEKYLLSHCTIVAAVDTELANPADPKSDWYIHPAYSKLVNNNGDAWSKKMLAASYRTFIGANNYQEHVQIPELAKGKVVDAVLREVPIGKDANGKDITTYYVDILVATDRKHTDLVRKIQAGQMNSLSMGCFLEGTEITMSNGTKIPIEQVKPGDFVVTHTGRVQPVMNVQKRWYQGDIHAIQVEGDHKITYVTSEHPFWGFRKEATCACGCGETFPVRLSGHKSKSADGLPLIPRYKKGHYARVVNPNVKTYSFEDYAARRENNPIREGMKLGWVNAENLRVGDIVSYPVSDVIYKTDDATVEKARLLGYFLAEGSFLKEVVIQGEENDYGVRCKICGGIYNLLCAHVPSHGMTIKQYSETYPGSPTKAKISKSLIHGKSRNEDLSGIGMSKGRRRVGVEFSLGGHEYDTLNQEIADLASKVFPMASIYRYPKAVKIISAEAAEFFYGYCGEYSTEKRLHEDALYWPQEIQRHLMAAWVLGDLNTTSSKNLADQFRFVFNRLRVHHNIFRVEASEYKCNVSKITADGDVVTQHYEGIRAECYQIQLNLQGFRALEKELNHSFNFTLPSRYSELSVRSESKIAHDWKNSQSLGWMTRPVKKADRMPYEGWVYNFEVNGDNSYIANDIACHNCKIAYSICTKCGKKAIDESQACTHVRYEKNNTFYDNNGVQRKVAELCGHYTDPESVTFIDASWVANPAFTGAVIRNVVMPPKDIQAKIEAAAQKPGYVKKMGDLVKTAAGYMKKMNDLLKIAADEDTPPEPGEVPATEPAPEEAPVSEKDVAPPADEAAPPADAPADEAPPAGDEGGTPAGDITAPAGDEGAAPTGPVPPEQEPKSSPVVELKEKLKKNIIQELMDDLTEEVGDELEMAGGGGGPRELDTLDETMIQPTASRALRRAWKMRKSWDTYLMQKYGNLDREDLDKLRFGSYMILSSNNPLVLKNYGYNRRDFLAVMSCVDECIGKPLAPEIRRAIAAIQEFGEPVKKIVNRMERVAGRKIVATEGKKALAWLRILKEYA